MEKSRRGKEKGNSLQRVDNLENDSSKEREEKENEWAEKREGRLIYLTFSQIPGSIERRSWKEGRGEEWKAWFNEVACQRDLRARLPGTWVRIAGIGREDERKDIPGEPRHGTVAGQPSWQIIVGAAARREVCEEAVVDE